MAALGESGRFSDVVLVADGGAMRLPAHRAVLAMRSRVFDRLWSQDDMLEVWHRRSLGFRSPLQKTPEPRILPAYCVVLATRSRVFNSLWSQDGMLEPRPKDCAGRLRTWLAMVVPDISHILKWARRLQRLLGKLVSGL